ncbi:MAG: M1 family aminopeptidase [Planctomycetota bacterium]
MIGSIGRAVGFLALAAGAAVQDGSFPVELTGYTIRVEVDPAARRIAGTAAVGVVALENGVTTIPFALNAALQIVSIREGEEEVPFAEGQRIAEGRAIALAPASPLVPKKPRTFTFSYAGEGVDPGPGDPDWMGILLVRPDEIRMSHQAQWYPIVPRDESARSVLTAPVEIELALPAGMVSLGPGRHGGVRTADRREVHLWSSAVPARASLLAGAYEVQELKTGRRELRVLAFPDHRDGGRKWAVEAGRSLEFHEKRLGKVKEAYYGIAEMHVRNREKSYNYEADGFAVFDSVLFDGRDADPAKVAHETAHLWWGGEIDPVGPGERFLTESLAEFSALVYLEEAKGEEAAAAAARERIDRYGRNPGEEHPLAVASFASPRYQPVVYAKGPMALRTLRFWAGEKDFEAGLALYIKRFRAGKVAPGLDDFLAAMRSKCGAQIDRWAAEWLERPGAPQYVVKYTMAGDLAGPLSVTVQLLQRGDIYTNPVEVDVILQNGGTERVLLEPRGAEATQTVFIPALVERLVVDPRSLVLSLPPPH